MNIINFQEKESDPKSASNSVSEAVQNPSDGPAALAGDNDSHLPPTEEGIDNPAADLSE